ELSELAQVEEWTGLRVPTLAELSEIERSSRLRSEGAVFYLSTPVVYRSGGEAPHSGPLGFVLTPERLVTVRFGPLTSFSVFGEDFGGAPTAHSCPAEAFPALVEAIVDRIADILEGVAEDLEHLSHRLYRVTAMKRKHHPGRHEAGLRNSLRQLGHSGDL